MIFSRKSRGIPLGYEWNTRKGKYGKRVTFTGQTAPHLLLLGPNGSGKGTRLLIPALLELTGRSIVVIDPKGELAAVTAAWRRTVSQVVILNPFGLLADRDRTLQSAGFNPLAALDPHSPAFYDDAAGLSEALIQVEGDAQRHFPESARGLVTAAIMWECKTAGPNASLQHVRMMLTAADEWETVDGEKRLTAGLRHTALLMCEAAKQFPDQGGWQIASLASRFIQEFNNETSGVRSTADTQTAWMLSGPMAADLARNGIDFRQLKRKPFTVYVVLPAERLRTHGVWLRLVITAALRSLYSSGGVPVSFMLDEAAQLGHLGPIEDALGQARGYGISLAPMVFQDWNQVTDLYGRRAETFAAASGAVFGFAPSDMQTAEWMSRRSGQETIMGVSAGEAEDGDLQGARTTFRPETRPVLPPYELLNLPEGHGLVWFAGRAKPVPVYAPPYWDVQRYAARARPNPYASASARRRGLFRAALHDAVRAAKVATLAGLVVLGVVLLFQHERPSSGLISGLSQPSIHALRPGYR